MPNKRKVLELALAMAKRHRSLAAAEWVMSWFGILTFGREEIEGYDRTALYVNVGETYESTILFCRGRYEICSWGDWYESNGGLDNVE